MDYFDAAAYGEGDLAAACASIKAKVLLISYSSDWLYPPSGTREVAEALLANGQPVSYIEVESRYGHDAFLLEMPRIAPLLKSFLNKV
jgi:homoserine O-acetyltransferase/O-succinyltransferase